MRVWLPGFRHSSSVNVPGMTSLPGKPNSSGYSVSNAIQGVNMSEEFVAFVAVLPSIVLIHGTLQQFKTICGSDSV